jgi:hypothetical protein
MNEDKGKLTAEEGQAIAEFLGEHWGMDSEEEITDIRETMRAVVVRDYMSDGPGYFGDIFFVVFGGGPEFHLVLTNYKGQGFEFSESEFQQFSHDPGRTLTIA